MKKSKPLSVEVELTILKPVGEVFSAVVNPVPYSVEKISGPLAEGKTIQWKFQELAMQVPVKVTKGVPNRLIRFEWASQTGGQNTVEFKFSKPQDHNPNAKTTGDATTVSITESGWPDDVKGRECSYKNLMGWTHMACALKAYLEHGVNLCDGAFLHMKF